MLTTSSVQNFSFIKEPKRRVSLRRDGADFIVALQPDNLVVFRHHELHALRKLCKRLRWEIVADVEPDPRDPATW